MPTLNSGAFSVIVNRDTSSSMISNNFTITVNRPTSSPSLGETVVKVSKRGVALVGTNNTSPSDGYFCFTIIKTDGCRATKSGVDSLRIDSIEEDVGTVTLNINAENKSNYTKVITVLKANQGVVGEDGYTVILTNEAHTFLGDETKALESSTNCGVIVYKGSTRVSATIGTPTGMPDGMTITINNNSTINASVTIAVTSSMTRTSGEVTIPITVNNRTFNKVFTYSLALRGADGSDAKFLGLSADRQVVAFDSSGKAKDSTAITLTATQQNFNDAITWTTSPSVTLTGSGKTRKIATSSFDSNNYIKVTITSGTLSDSVTLVKVVDGANGMDGVPGDPGENGITYYTWIRYADDENGTNISNSPIGKNYIGLAYNKTTSVESNDPSDYNWFKVVGEKGDTGEPGEPGADGTTYYTWIKYSDYADGTDLYDIPNDGTKYIGIAVNRLTASESNNKADYVWSKFKGEDGRDGTSITILGSYDSEEALNNAHPNNNTIGDSYIVNGDLYVWTGETFNNVGNIKGEDGRTSYFHVKYSNDGGLTFTSNNGEDVGLYMGTYVNFIESDSTNVDDYTWVLIKGEQGINGADGVDGKDGTSIVWKGTFDKHPSNPEDGWAYKNSTDKKSYVYQDGTWYQMTIDGTDGIDGNDGKDGLSIEYKGELASAPSNPVKNWCYKDADNGTVYIYTGTSWEVLTYDGSDGIDGATGDDGLSVFITYHDSETKPNTPTGSGATNGWHTDCTENVIWMSQKVSDSATTGTWGEPIKIRGIDGKDGTSVTILGTYNSLDELNAAHGSGNTNGDGYIIQGDLYVWDGTQFLNVGKIKGEDGINGVSSYLHIKYSNDGGRTFTSNDGEDVGDYMGVYTDSTISDSMNPADYKWTKIKGEQGIQGEQGVPGNDGQTTYFHIKYSANANGNPMTETPSTYIGTYVDYTQADSNDYTKYTWSRFQGLQGEQGLPGTNGENGQTYYLHIKYSNDGGNTFTSNNGEDAGTYIGVYTDTTQADSTSVSKYTWSKIKGEDGVDGTDGKDGEKGQSLVSSVPQWYLSTSNTTQTGGSWVEAMPKLTSGKYLWLRYKLTWENPSSITYTTPTLEQVAESMKDVVSKQSQLEQTVEGFKTTVSETYATKNALNDVDKKFDDYSTTTSMNSAINQKSNEILSTVNETYATKTALNNVDGKFTNYSTTTAMNSAIDQKANEIKSTVSETYATKTSVTDLSNNLTNNYSTTKSMNSAINQKANEITSSVSETYATKDSVTSSISTVQQTASKIDWLIKSGTSSANMVLTDNALSVIANNINLTGKVTFSCLDNSTQNTINTANSNASTALSTANTANTNATTALNTANSVNTTLNNNKDNWTNAYNRVKQWASGDVSGSTTINGGMLATGTVTAKHIYLGDLTNYCNLSEQTASLYGFTSISDNGGTWYKLNNLQRDTCISGNKANDYYYYKCNGGESFRIKYQFKSSVKGSTSSGGTDSAYCGINIGCYGKKSDGSNFWQLCSGGTSNASLSIQTISSTITLPSDAVSFGIFLQMAGWGNWSGECYIRNVEVFKMSNGELIVDGSITANKIAAGSINADKIAGKELVGVTLRNADSTFTVDGNGNITGASITSSVGDNWQIDQSGNMEVKDLSVEGTLTCKGIAIEDIQSPKYPSTLDADIKLYVSNLTGSDDYSLDEILQSYDESEEQGSVDLIKKFYSLKGLEAALPRNLNGKTVRIYCETDDNGQVLFSQFVSGRILIFLCSHEVKGYIGSYNCYSDFKIYGGNTQSAPTTYGVIRPSTNTVYSSDNSSIFIQKSPVSGVYYCNIYGGSSASGYSAVKVTEDCMCRIEQCNFYSAYTFVNVSSLSQVFCNITTGKATDYAFKSYTGSMLHLANTKQASGTKGNVYCSNGSVIYGTLAQTISGTNGITWDGTSTVIENTTTTTKTTTATATYKSNYGDTYRSTVYNSWKKDNTCRQGDWGYGDCTGLWFFGTQFSELKGKTIKSVKITISRQTGGSSSAVTHKLWMHNYSSRPSGAPTLTSGWSQTFSLATGNSTTVTITDSTVLNAIKAGTCKGFAIRHTYSSGYYSVCSGSATVKITYEE